MHAEIEKWTACMLKLNLALKERAPAQIRCAARQLTYSALLSSCCACICKVQHLLFQECISILNQQQAECLHPPITVLLGNIIICHKHTISACVHKLCLMKPQLPLEKLLKLLCQWLVASQLAVVQ